MHELNMKMLIPIIKIVSFFPKTSQRDHKILGLIFYTQRAECK